MTVLKCFQRFLNDRSVYCASKTIEIYTGHLNLFFRYLENLYGKSVSVLCFSDIPLDDNIYSSYILYLRTKEEKIKNTSVRCYARHVKAFLKFCYEHDFCRDYLKGVKLPRDDSVAKLPLYSSEVRDIDATFDMSTVLGCRNYCIVHLMLDCGLRCSEVVNLEMKDLDRVHKILHLRNSKGCKSRMVLCPGRLFKCIDNYRNIGNVKGDYVFESVRIKGARLSKNAVKQMFYDLKSQSGVERVHAHLLRHTFATSYLIGGGNLEFLRVFMGHYDYTVTKNYSSLAAQCKMLGADIYKLDDIFFKIGY